MSREVEISAAEVDDRLALALERAGSAKAFSVKNGLSPQYVADVRHGRRAAGPRLLAALGVRRQVRLLSTEA